MVSGSFSLLCSRFFSPFLHSTGSLSVSREYLALRDGPRRFIQDFSCPALLRILLSLSLVSPTGLSPSLTGLSRPFGYLLLCLMQSFYPDSAETEPVWALPLSLAATNRIDVSFSSSPYLDVSVQEVPDLYLCIQYRTTEVCSARFPHSEICGSLNICFLPQLIAAYHVFHRLSVPRHPPCALSNLTLQHT